MKRFNTTAVCIPAKHYMVDLSLRVREIRSLIDDGKYFTINKARQYGKTTTLNALQLSLQNDYIVVSLSFEGISEANFSSEQSFVKSFCRLFKKKPALYQLLPERIKLQFEDYLVRKEDLAEMDELFLTLREWCAEAEKPIVMLIDEIDSATNNQVFLDFLAQLRDGYISRDTDNTPAFQSVILAGVTDVKYLKSKIRTETDSRQNSPWNIAADFTIDMSLSESGIKGMLGEYEADHVTGMDTGAIAKQIREYTNGYPFLVSRICQLIDERLVPETFSNYTEAWSAYGVDEAVKILITEKNTLFDSLMGKLHDYPALCHQLRTILLQGETIEYLPDNTAQDQLQMYGFIVNNHNTVAVANRIFEMRLYKYFVGESRFAGELRGDALDHKTEFIKDGLLDVPLIMERFIASQKQIRKIDDKEAEKKFIEEEGRERFLTYLSPIINGVGTYSIEEQTRTRQRMDIVIHYLGRRYIIELKIWRGRSYHEKGEQQLLEYLNYWNLDTGYLLSFNFNKHKEPGVYNVGIDGKTIIEGIV